MRVLHWLNRHALAIALLLTLVAFAWSMTAGR